MVHVHCSTCYLYSYETQSKSNLRIRLEKIRKVWNTNKNQHSSTLPQSRHLLLRNRLNFYQLRYQYISQNRFRAEQIGMLVSETQYKPQCRFSDIDVAKENMFSKVTLSKHNYCFLKQIRYGIEQNGMSIDETSLM